MSDLTSTAAVKSLLGITGTASDTLLGTLVTEASARIASYLGFDPISQQYPETFDGDDRWTIVLGRPNVTAISSLKVNGQTIDPATSTADGYVFTSAGVVTLVNPNGWPTFLRFWYGFQNVAVTYTAGYASNAVPADLAGAAVELTGYLFEQGKRLGVMSRNEAGASIAYQTLTLPVSITTVLDRYAGLRVL